MGIPSTGSLAVGAIVGTGRRPLFRSLALRDTSGARKYVTDTERRAFLAIATRERPSVQTLFLALAYTGCRLSEALESTVSRVDFDQVALVFRTLKRRSPAVAYRTVPVPQAVLARLDQVHDIRSRQTDPATADTVLWPWSRTHAWRLVKDGLIAAGVRGAAASPKGLRHGFGVTAVTKGVSLNLVQKWLGHAQIATTAIYADAVGDEERAINARMWG